MLGQQERVYKYRLVDQLCVTLSFCGLRLVLLLLLPCYPPCHPTQVISLESVSQLGIPTRDYAT